MVWTMNLAFQSQEYVVQMMLWGQKLRNFIIQHPLQQHQLQPQQLQQQRLQQQQSHGTELTLGFDS